MRGFRTSLILLALILVSVAGMLALLRPSLFSAGGLAGSGPLAEVVEAAAQHETPGAQTDGSPTPGTATRDSVDENATTDPTDPADATDPATINPANPTDAERREPGAKRLYLVLDDAGHDLDQLRMFTSFPGTFTVAVLPGLEYSREATRMVIALGHEAILHQPMEALGGNDPGPGAIFTDQSSSEIRRVLISNLATLPGVIGVNNHMGSRATADQRVMEVVAETIGRYRLFFLDSRTTHLSVAADQSRASGLAAVERDVFLDNVRDETAISRQIDQGLAIAARQGHAVMIGHVTSPELARVLTNRYAEIAAAGYAFLPLSDLVSREYARITHADTGH